MISWGLAVEHWDRSMSGSLTGQEDSSTLTNPITAPPAPVPTPERRARVTPKPPVPGNPLKTGLSCQSKAMVEHQDSETITPPARGRPPRRNLTPLGPQGTQWSPRARGDQRVSSQARPTGKGRTEGSRRRTQPTGQREALQRVWTRAPGPLNGTKGIKGLIRMAQKPKHTRRKRGQTSTAAPRAEGAVKTVCTMGQLRK